MAESLALRPIGYVRNGVREMKRDGWEEVISEIVLDAVPAEALDGIEEYSHVEVIFWFSKLEPSRRAMWKVRPRGRQDLPLVGIFATRTQYRPNPLGLTTAQLLSREGAVLRVKGLDAIDGTPVIDVKPPSPRHDPPEKIRYPEWVQRMLDR